ncbi:DUF1659 domain-containing protein [Kyrpidia spormannii]|uniref:DUF1659 domain-containing protein n=3 Tax=Kyrpidia TaxID=1129704 RepID=A0A2K8N2I6_9BACL|nr:MULTISPECIES: DUF1659 domain-containing protein [Kyrpidia]HHY66695.1 DUF1659 domain-containing protein [Alicyclobacillus sp.]ADG04995.1 protein of unknown function DUF1659 [Kyrpidia tusciae DSM 2912]ATY83754.1 DUF1659 domain-containing protein [Kyrpidia spormannii]MCL6575281.1 DUF1659 domain-containing protein [Kyrpidia sp.]CAB3389397.1 conserved protein of unknown function [Kyrpidia spormannii]
MVQPNPNSVSLVLVYQVGTTPTGDPVLRRQTYRGIKPGVSPDNLYAAAELIAGLQIHPVYEVDRSEVDELLKQ